jgi:hypothetical protein
MKKPTIAVTGRKKILHLTLKKKWFDMIASGEKTEEYREIKAFWAARLLYRIELPREIGGFLSPLRDIAEGNYDFKNWKQATGSAPVFHEFNWVNFTNGYRPDSRIMRLPCKGIEIREGLPEWGAEPGKKYFVIKLGERI